MIDLIIISYKLTINMSSYLQVTVDFTCNNKVLIFNKKEKSNPIHILGWVALTL